VKDLPKVPTWRQEWDSNLQPSGRKAPNLLMNHHAHVSIHNYNNIDEVFEKMNN